MGLSTVLITNMPYWAERIGVPRTLGVEFPFGHPLGAPGDVSQQLRVLTTALNVLRSADYPGTIWHSDETWPEAVEQAIQAWQPDEPSPIIADLKPKFRELLRSRRNRST
ncbi:MAG: hypothetical protein ACK2T2_01765 [Anaerolineales bacterium]